MELKVVRSFDDTCRHLAGLMVSAGVVVDTGHWQSLTDVPQTRTIELTGVTLKYDVPPTMQELEQQVQPNMPWAELHFAERVGGEGTNPGKTYHLWPYFRGNVPKHQDPANGDRFSHTYMERIWPRFAGGVKSAGFVGHHGIRFRYGDLTDVLALLHEMPSTRQAYLPIWFPEDTGAHHGERVPCTLGYHFMLRDNRLHCMYPIRSCDFLRHFRDDVYLAGRLMQWIIGQLGELEPDTWGKVNPGTLSMHMHSLHVFEPERPILMRMAYTDAEQEYGAAV